MIPTAHGRRTGDVLLHLSARLFSMALVVSAIVSATIALSASRAWGQSNNFAAAFLVQPVGARSVGHGEAAVADTALGTEGLWWNPAAMARMRKREFAVHSGQTFLANTYMLSVAYPSKELGTIAAGVFLANYGDQSRTDSVGNAIGVLTNRYYVLSAGYATPVGKRFSAGVTAKSVLLRFVCSGCADALSNRIGKTYALDVGAQYIVSFKIPATIGASVRNLGGALQAKDEPQADPLPLIVQVGTQLQLPFKALAKNLTTIDVSADVLSSPAYSAPSVRVGADLSYNDQYTARVGYKYIGPNDGLEGGLTAGFGLKYKSWQVDIARRFDSSSSLGESSAPTYVSLRYVW